MPRITPVGFLASLAIIAAMDALTTIRLTCPTCDRVIAPSELAGGICPGCSTLMDCEELREQADSAAI